MVSPGINISWLPGCSHSELIPPENRVHASKLMMGPTRKRLTVLGVRDALWRTVEAVPRKHTLQMAAAMAYYFVLALFPALILLSAILAYMPIHNMLDQVMGLF